MIAINYRVIDGIVKILISVNYIEFTILLKNFFKKTNGTKVPDAEINFYEKLKQIFRNKKIILKIY